MRANARCRTRHVQPVPRQDSLTRHVDPAGVPEVPPGRYFPDASAVGTRDASSKGVNTTLLLTPVTITWAIPDQLAYSHSPTVTDLDTVREDVDEWIRHARLRRVKSIICLLDAGELHLFYDELPGGLLTYYRSCGFQVAHIPASGYGSPPLLDPQLREILEAYRSLPKPVLVHCRSGVGRTGVAVEHIMRHEGFYPPRGMFDV
jgi:hypothetical protein